MIDLKELRIGNAVGLLNKAGVFTVKSIPKDLGVEIRGSFAEFNDFTTREAYADMEDLTGVELTEEWYVNFGFLRFKRFGPLRMNLFDTGIYQAYAGIDILIGESMPNGLACIEVSGTRFPLHHIKYVHQLQNLYHALMGQELLFDPMMRDK